MVVVSRIVVFVVVVVVVVVVIVLVIVVVVVVVVATGPALRGCVRACSLPGTRAARFKFQLQRHFVWSNTSVTSLS